MLLKTQNLTKRYADKLAVNAVNLEIIRGSFTTLLGTNGAGKSTLIKMMIGLKQPTSGKVIKNNDLKIGVVFQNSILDNDLTVHENLLIRAHQYQHLAHERINELEQQLGLTKFQQQRYGTLSGGQKRRADIARALLNKPDILFLDEPTTGLDIQTRTAIWQLLLKLQQEHGLTILLTTHYLEEADKSNYCYILNRGQIVASGTTQDIITKHATNQLHLIPSNIEKLTQLLTTQHINFKQEKAGILIEPQNMLTTVKILTLVQGELNNFTYSSGDIATAFMNITGWEVK